MRHQYPEPHIDCLSPQAVALFVVAMAFWGARAGAADIYVSNAGSDRSSGRSPSAAVRTIQEGVNRARAGDTVVVLAGIYRETIVFPHSGLPGRPITVRAYRGGRVLVTGCDPVPGWSKDRTRPRVWSAPMPWTLGPGRNQVFESGRVLIEARFPNRPAPGLGMYVAGLSPLWPTYGAFPIPDPAHAPGRITGPLLKGQPPDYWKGALYVGGHYENWCLQTGVIESSGDGEITVGDRTDTWWFPLGEGYSPEEGRGMIVGSMNALDQPGEWCLSNGRLYLIPPDGRPPRGIEAKRRQLAFDLSGREHIVIQGISIRAASLRLDNSAYCRVDRCDLAYISHFTLQYSMGQVERGRDTIRSGETGIFVGGHDNAFLSCSVRFSAGAGFHLRGYHQTIHNCLIDEVDYTAHYLNAITDAVNDFGEYEGQLVGGHVITFNTMRNAGRHMFNFSGNGTSLASRTRGPMDYMATLFAHNHIYNGMLLTKDAGMITGYHCSGGSLDGLNSLVAYSAMHDSWDIFGMRINALGIVYLDEGTCNVTLRSNLLWAAPGSLQRGFWFNTSCVGVREVDNVFHPDFERTCAQLLPSDFPNRKPFRFGCDFAHPPAVPKWPQLESQVLAIPSAGASLRDGSVVPLGPVDLARGWRSAVMRLNGTPAAANGDTSSRAAPRHRSAIDPLVLEATVNDGESSGIAHQWTFAYNLRDGAWLRFSKVPLDDGYRRFRVIYGCVEDAQRSVEVRLDSVGGPLAARIPLRRTDRERGGRIQIYEAATADVSPSATGTHDVYLVFHSTDHKPVGEFEYFRFERYRGRIGLQKDEVRVELRAGSPDGDTIGVLYPRRTRGSAAPDFVTSLESASGRKPLFAVVRSNVPGPLGRMVSLRLEKAHSPQDLSAIELPPRAGPRGRMVLPAATNRPIARPADRYGHTSSIADETLVRSAAAATGRFVPRAGLALWLDAAAMNTLVHDSSGRLSVWRERSGNGRDAAQAVEGYRPVLAARALNGMPAAVFDDRRQTRMDVPDLSPDRMTAMVFAVVSNPARGDPSNHDPRILTASDGKELDYIAGICADVPGMETGGPRQMQWIFVDRWARYVRLGCFSPMYQTYFNGLISEVLVYDRTLTASEQRRVRTYLYSKWGVK